MTTPPAESPEPRYLALGIADLPSPVVSYSWDQILKMPSVADWDWVIMDLSSLNRSLGSVEANILLGGNLSGARFRKVVDSGGGLVTIIGAHRDFRFGPENAVDMKWWWPHVTYAEESGETRYDVSPELQHYFRNVRQWHCIIADSSRGTASALARNKNGEVIATHIVTQESRPGIYIVPRADACDPKTACMILLEDVCGLRFGPLPPPEWTTRFHVPGQDKIESELASLHEQAERLAAHTAALETKLDEVTTLRRLLYEEGHTLEVAVKDALAELGARIRPQATEKDEDAVIESTFGVGALEIKKSNSSASKDHVRQVDEWVGKLVHAGEDPKGILIINHFAKKDPSERDEPFPQNVIDFARSARKRPFCLMTSVQLFDAVCSVRAEKASAPMILKSIFDADGPYLAPPT